MKHASDRIGDAYKDLSSSRSCLTVSMPLPDAVPHRPQQGSSQATPLVVNFEGAILRTDLLHERIAALVKSEPWMLPNLVLAASKGRPALDVFLMARSDSKPSLAAYPRDPEAERLVADARQEGREIAWISGEDLGVEAARGEMTALLDVAPEVYRRENSAENQAMVLEQRFPHGFAYVGRSAADLPLWRAARERFGVGLSSELLHRTAAEKLGIVELSPRRSLLRPLIRSLRPHQWLKNLLVFVPFALDYGQLHGRDIGNALLAFVCLCALTSGTYLVNDLFDVEADRRHPRKRTRPIANGDLPIATAALAGGVLMVTALGGGGAAPPSLRGSTSELPRDYACLFVPAEAHGHGGRSGDRHAVHAADPRRHAAREREAFALASHVLDLLLPEPRVHET